MRKLNVFNVRLGLATNSSSTHSMIFAKAPLTDSKLGNDQTSGYYFGWNHFTAASRKSKSQYIGAILADALLRSVPASVAEVIFPSFAPDGVNFGDSDIDHQSQMALPFGFHENFIDKQFFKELSDFILRDDVVILGGNDNGGELHPNDDGSSFRLAIPRDDISQQWTCRKDFDKYWIIFNRKYGDKFKFSFDEKLPPLNKAEYPELVDIKITDYCPFGCSFCYQGSTTSGLHADTKYIFDVADKLSEMKVFEVAIGGGEPTMHPSFIEILRYFRERGIVPNFTTKSTAWYKDVERKKEILKVAGGFAVSATGTIDECKEIAETFQVDLSYVIREKCNIHLVMGIDDRETFEEKVKILCEKGLGIITLLGYKTTGRGKDIRTKDYSWWIESIKSLKNTIKWYFSVSIDTVLAREFQKELEDEKVSRILYHTEEGKFSCYIDAVAKQIAPSSFCSMEEKLPLLDVSLIKEKFGTF